MTTKRKPYIRPIERNWWTTLGFYKAYILRECTSLFAIWFSLVLLYGLFSMAGGIRSYTGFLAFLANPIVLILNIISFIAALWQTYTWFNLTPKAALIIVKGEKLPAKCFVFGGWAVMLIVSIIMWFILIP